MNGIEKIITRIEGDAQQEVDAVLAKATEDASLITQQYQVRIEKECAEILRRGQQAATEREERLASVTQMEARKLTLAAQQEMLSKAFDLALTKLTTLPEEEYIDLLANFVVKGATTGGEEVIFSQKDRTQYGKAVVTRANQMLEEKFPQKAAQGVLLTLSPETRPIKGGVILSDGSVEVNCSFETLVHLQRGVIDREVAKELFV